MGVAHSVPQRVDYHAGGICFLELTREHGIYGTPAPEQQLVNPVGEHTFAFHTRCVTPVGQLLFLLLLRHSANSIRAQDERLATSP